MATGRNSLGTSVSRVLTYSVEVMVGKVVLMQPRRLIHGVSAFGASRAQHVTAAAVKLTELNDIHRQPRAYNV